MHVPCRMSIIRKRIRGAMRLGGLLDFLGNDVIVLQKRGRIGPTTAMSGNDIQADWCLTGFGALVAAVLSTSRATANA